MGFFRGFSGFEFFGFFGFLSGFGFFFEFQVHLRVKNETRAQTRFCTGWVWVT
jgi:hypothetical protein